MWPAGRIGKPLPGREVKLGPDGEVLVRGDVDLARHLVGRGVAAARGGVAGHRRPGRERAGRRTALPGAQERGDRDRGGREPAPRRSGGGHRAGAGRGGLRGGGDGDGIRAGALRGAGHARPRRAGRGGHRARQPEAGGVSAAAALGAVAGAGPAAHLDRQGAAQGGGGVAGRNPGRGCTATRRGCNGQRQAPLEPRRTGCWR